MMSIVVLMIITIIAITGEAADLQTNIDSIEVASEIEGCPYLENAEYEVTLKTSVSALVGGCAYIHYNPSSIKSQLFSVYFGNKHHDGQHCIDRGMEFFHFYCLSKSPSRLVDSTSGRMYIRLYNEDVKKEGGQDRRCALYHKIADNDFLMTFVVMISSDASCVGLSDTLYSPRWIPSHKEESMLLIFNRTKFYPPLIPAATTTESIQSISNLEGFGYLRTPAAITTTESTHLIHDLYERRRYMLQNFGYRTDPFWETKSTVNHTSEKRELQMSDGVGRHDAVMDISSYDGLKSGVDDKDVTVTTIKHKNWLRQLLAINHTQIRRKRSKSNVMST